MFCHGELARLKPAPNYLTRFYLMVSLGGALGSVLVGIVAPVVLSANFELALGLVACAALLAWQVRRDPPVFGALAIVATVTTVGCAIWGIDEFYDATDRHGTQFLRRAARPGDRHRLGTGTCR